MAEGARFELARDPEGPLPAFRAGAFNRSASLPLWYTGQDSNLRPWVYKAPALTAVLPVLATVLKLAAVTERTRVHADVKDTVRVGQQPVVVVDVLVPRAATPLAPWSPEAAVLYHEPRRLAERIRYHSPLLQRLSDHV